MHWANSTVTDMHVLAEKSYRKAHLWSRRQLHKTVEQMKQSRLMELELVEKAKERWAAQIEKIKQPYDTMVPYE